MIKVINDISKLLRPPKMCIPQKLKLFWDVERKYYLNTPSKEYKTYACLPLVRWFFCLVLYSGSSTFILMCILFISGVAGQTSCPEASRWSEFQDGELQHRRRPTVRLQRGAWCWGPAFLRGGLITGPTERALACWYVWPLALDQV